MAATHPDPHIEVEGSMTSRETTTPPTRPRLPTAAEAEDMCGRAALEAFRELNEEKRRKKAKPNTIIAGPCVTPILNGDVARVVELPEGGLRIEWWVKGTGWTEAPHGAFDLADFVPGDTNRPVLPKDAARLECRLEDFGRHWTEEPATPADRAKIIGLIKTRAWDLAVAGCPPGRA
jgi:hypothetical protein